MRRHEPRSWVREEAGESPVSLLIMAPVLALLIVVVIAVGRISGTENAVAAAAAAGARDATLASDPWTAQTAAEGAATRTLNQQGVHCSGMSLTIDAAALNNEPGVPGNVHVNVHCNVPLADLAIPGLPGTRAISGSSISPVDTYRDRS